MHMVITETGGDTHNFIWDNTPWSVNQGGTGATSFTNGSIPFISSGIFSQNNLQLFWDSIANTLSIGGTTTPAAKLSVKGSGTLNLLNLASSAGTNLFTVDQTGSTTIADGVNITNGCYAINGTCISAATSSGSVTTGTQGQVAYYGNNGSLLSGSSAIFISPSGFVGINNTNPQHALDVSGALYSRLITDSDSAAATIDWNKGNIHLLPLNTSSTVLSFANGQAGGEYKVILQQDGTGGRTVTWPSNAEWPTGTAPALSTGVNAKDVISFVFDGTNYLGSSQLDYQFQNNSETINSNQGNNGIAGFGQSGREQYASRFTTTAGGYAGTGHVCLYDQGAPTDNVVVGLESDSSGLPSDIPLATVSIPNTSINTTHQSIAIDFGRTVHLSASTNYWLVFSRTGGADDTNLFFSCGSNGTGDPAFPSASRASGIWSSLISGSENFDLNLNATQ